MRDLMKAANLPYPEFSHDGIFTITLRRSIDFAKWLKAWEEQLTQNRIDILKLVHADPSVSIKELSNKIGISSTAIDKNLAILKDLGLIDREGTRGGEWRTVFLLPPAKPEPEP